MADNLMTQGYDDNIRAASKRSILLRDYMREIAPTDRLRLDDLRPVLMGLFGEVGSIMATAKKLHREKQAYAGYRNAVEEEFGDALWYLAALCRRLSVGLDSIISDAASGDRYCRTIMASDLVEGPVGYISSIETAPSLDDALLKLGDAAASLLVISGPNQHVPELLRTFADCYLQALQVAQVTFSQVVYKNIEKACGRFLEPDPSTLPTFDSGFLDEEKLPRQFEIKITQRKSGQCYLQWNGVFIGDPLTDNILDPDGYRFHDVFHFAHAAILHWSPTFRALIKQKRKSDRKVDEAQDGGRAIVIEEGLTAWIFARAKHLNFFERQDGISFDLLKTVEQFVQGYEVEACPLKLWERAILDGYAVFRQVREHNGGIVIGNRDDRTIRYKPIT
jgi:hypothetical protein